MQPHGPYRLGGYSAGCITAFEMAQQLLDAGEVVDVLVLFDPSPIRDQVYGSKEETNLPGRLTSSAR